MVTSLRYVPRSREEVERDPQNLPRLPSVPHCPCRHVYDRSCASRQAYLRVLIFSKETNPHLARLNFPPLGFVMAWMIKKSLIKPEQLLVDEMGLWWVTHNTPFIRMSDKSARYWQAEWESQRQNGAPLLYLEPKLRPVSRWGQLVPRLGMGPDVLGWWIAACPGHGHFAAYNVQRRWGLAMSL